MNKKAQEFGTGIILGIIVGVFGVILLASAGFLTGFISCGTGDCQFVTREADYKIVGNSDFSGKSSLSSDFKVKLENKEDQAANFKINMYCNTAKDSKIISSDTIYVQPQSIEEFPIKYDVGILEDWKCSLSSVETATIDSCDAV